VYDHSVITVEHVLPQHPAGNSQWREWFTEEDAQAWVHRLANLVLLDRRKNSAASNHDFEVKKTTYFMTKNQTSPFKLTSQVLSVQDWTPARLQARQRELLHAVVKIWGLEPPAAA